MPPQHHPPRSFHPHHLLLLLLLLQLLPLSATTGAIDPTTFPDRTLAVNTTVALPASCRLLYSPSASKTPVISSSSITLDTAGDFLLACPNTTTTTAPTTRLLLRAVLPTGHVLPPLERLNDTLQGRAAGHVGAPFSGDSDHFSGLWQQPRASPSCTLTALGPGVGVALTTASTPTSTEMQSTPPPCGMQTAAAHAVNFFAEPLEIALDHVRLVRNGSGSPPPPATFSISFAETPTAPAHASSVRSSRSLHDTAPQLSVQLATDPTSDDKPLQLSIRAGSRVVLASTAAASCSARMGVRLALRLDWQNVSLSGRCDDGRVPFAVPNLAHGLSWTAFADAPYADGRTVMQLSVSTSAPSVAATATVRGVAVASLLGPRTGPAVLRPLVGGASVAPVPLGSDQPLVNTLGLLDVSAQPFNADRSGQTDATDALQNALNFAREHYLVAYFPVGTYLVTRTIECVQWQDLLPNGWVDSRGFPHSSGAGNNPHTLLGQTRAANGARAVLRVAPNTPFFGGNTNTTTPSLLRPVAPVLHLWAQCEECEHVQSQPNIHYSQAVSSLDIEIGEGNPMAVGLAMRGAQGAVLADVHIRLARDALAGVFGLSGGGGASLNLTVEGGRYAVDGRYGQPCSTVAGLVARNQSCAAVAYGGLQSLTLVGSDLEVAEGAVAVVAGCPLPPGPWTDPHNPCFLPPVSTTQPCNGPLSGQLSISHSVLRTGSGDGDRTAILTTRAVLLNNVHAVGFPWLANFTSVDAPAATAYSFPGDPQGRPVFVPLFARGQLPPLYTIGNRSWQYQAPVYADGKRLATGSVFAPGGVQVVQTVPDTSDLQRQHLFGPASAYPSFEQPDVLNVKDFGAVGDGWANDTAAFAAALAAAGRAATAARAGLSAASTSTSTVVLVPRGCYNISRTLRLPCGVQLVGVGVRASTISAPTYVHFAETLPLRPGVAAPLLYAEPCPTGPAKRTTPQSAFPYGTVLSHLQLLSGPGFHNGDRSLMIWEADQSGAEEAVHVARSIFLGEGTAAAPSFSDEIAKLARSAAANHGPNVPTTVLSGGGTRYYVYYSMGGGQYAGPHYRHLQVRNTSGPVAIYHCNTERALGETNTEIVDARDVAVFGLKCEGNMPALWIRNSSRVLMTGHGGVAAALPGNVSYPPGFARFTPSLYRITGSRDFKLGNLVDYGHVGQVPMRRPLSGVGLVADGPGPGAGVDPDLWHMALVQDAGANATAPQLTAVLDRPVLLAGGNVTGW